MDNDALQQAIQSMQAQLNQQGAQLQHVTRENAELRAAATRTEQRLADSDRDDPRAGRPVHGGLAGLVPPHLQLLPLSNDDRKRLLTPYPRYDLPLIFRSSSGRLSMSHGSPALPGTKPHKPEMPMTVRSSFRAAGAEGAYALMALDPSKEIHLDLKRFHKEFATKKDQP